MRHDSDEALMARYIDDGDRDAFRVLFDRYGDRLHRFFSRSAGPEVAADLVQTTFLYLHRARHDFDRRRALRPWLFAIACNTRREHWRRRKRRAETPLREGQEGFTAPSTSSVRDRLVRRALEQLPEHQREVMVLRWYGELSFAEIAAALGIRTNAAKVRAHRAHRQLRTLLGGEP
ncbi:MAG: RNA polymerase sigma factor [Myxococcota bacterium]